MNESKITAGVWTCTSNHFWSYQLSQLRTHLSFALILAFVKCWLGIFLLDLSRIPRNDRFYFISSFQNLLFCKFALVEFINAWIIKTTKLQPELPPYKKGFITRVFFKTGSVVTPAFLGSAIGLLSLLRRQMIFFRRRALWYKFVNTIRCQVGRTLVVNRLRSITDRNRRDVSEFFSFRKKINLILI